MVMEEPPEINPPSGRVPGKELLLILILGSRGWRNSGVGGKKESSPRVFGTDGKYMPKGGTKGQICWDKVNRLVPNMLQMI